MLILNKQMIYDSIMDVQLIVLILNKQIIYGSIGLILNKKNNCFMGARWIYSYSAHFE